MPTYEYECEACKRTFEVEQKLSEAPLVKCPAILDFIDTEQRHRVFKNACGTNGWTSHRGNEPGSTHPDRCVCQGNDPTPHKHYDEPPLSCARCGCSAYKPAVTERSCDGPLKRLISDSTSFVLKGSGWFKDGY